MGILGGASRRNDSTASPGPELQAQLLALAERMLRASRDEAEGSGLWAPTFSSSWFEDGAVTGDLGLATEVLSTLQRDLQMEPDWSIVDNTESGIRLRWWGGLVPLEIHASFARDTAFGPAIAVDARINPFEVSDPRVGGFMAMRLNRERATSYGWSYDPRTQLLFARAGGIMLQPPSFAVGGSQPLKRLRQSVHELYGIGSVTVGAILADFMEGKPQWATLISDIHPAKQKRRAEISSFLTQLGTQLHRWGKDPALAWSPRPVREIFDRFVSCLPSDQQERFAHGQEFLSSMGATGARERSNIMRLPYPSYEPATTLAISNESQPYLGPGLIVVHQTAYRIQDDSVPLLLSALVDGESLGGSGTSSLGWWFTVTPGSSTSFPAQEGEQLLGYATFLPQGRSSDVDLVEVVGEHVRRGWWLRRIFGAPQAPPAPALGLIKSP